jgi:hypothetical protein
MAVAWVSSVGLSSGPLLGSITSEGLRRRLDRLTEIQDASLRLACSLICLGFLTP